MVGENRLNRSGREALRISDVKDRGASYEAYLESKYR
jgi:hypothetical protein